MVKKDQRVKCVLVDPPDQISDMTTSRQAPRATEMHEVYPPLGLAYIAATLIENGIDVSLIEARTRSFSHDEVIKQIEKEAPQFVGITVITARINSALYLAEKVKKISPDIKVILGGPHIHFDHKTVINNDSVDFCARGEGEITCLELINCLSNGGNLAAIKGITFKHGNDIIVNPDRPFVESLDTFAFPARNLLHNPAYRGLWTEGQTFTPVLSTRGCPYQCAFCAAPRIWGRKHRRRSVENVLDAQDKTLPYVTLGEIHQAGGEHEKAVECIHRAQEIFEELMPEMKDALFDTIEEVIKKLPTREKFELASKDWVRIMYLVKYIEATYQIERDLLKRHGGTWKGDSGL